ncbi:MAG TPA: hypothetical protein VGF76_20025, partial [Polyangiaceae bacterium]
MPASRSSGALMLAIDRSATMTLQQKWQAVQISAVQALDSDLFDTTVLGMDAYPSGFTDINACLSDGICTGETPAECDALLGIPGVACGATGITVALAASGSKKSSAATGVRHDIYQYLSATTPVSSTTDDGSPAYEALAASVSTLQQTAVENRVLIWISDGSPNCASFSAPTRPGYDDGGGCADWEEPSTIETLIANAHTNAAVPIQTFVIGLPGSDSTGAANGSFATAPYHMTLAFSVFAVAGAPDYIDRACDRTAVFTKTGGAPADPCHVDLAGGLFSSAELTSAIDSIGARAL